LEKQSTRAPLAPFALSAAILVLDQVSKAFVAARVAPNTVGFSAFGDFFWITRQSNPGMAFSLLDKLPEGPRVAILIALPLILVAAVIAFYFKSAEPVMLQRWALCGIVGGGLGNVIDRIFRHSGVIDFISVKFYGFLGYDRWPTFNVADSSVVVSVLVLVVSTIVIDSRREDRKA
jgi:signal peptidase II